MPQQALVNFPTDKPREVRNYPADTGPAELRAPVVDQVRACGQQAPEGVPEKWHIPLAAQIL